MNKIHKSIRIAQDLLDKVNSLAKSEGRSFCAMIVRLLEHALKTYKQ